MNRLEETIREALARGPDDPPGREKVYHSARVALAKGLARRPDLAPELADRQHRELETVIAGIEAGYQGAEAIPAVEPAPPGYEAEVAAPAPEISVSGGRLAPDVEGPVSTPIPEPVVAEDWGDLRAAREDAPPAGPEAPRAPAPEPGVEPPAGAPLPRRPKVAGRKPRRALFAGLFVAACLLSFVGIALWWGYSVDLFDDTRATAYKGTNPGLPIEEEDFEARGATGDAPQPAGSFSTNWILFYVPGEPIETGANAEAAPVETADGAALKLVSRAGDESGEVRLLIPRSILERMAGARSTIALSAASLHGGAAEIAVACDFGALGTCGRFRFPVSREPADIIFQVDFSSGGTPQETGALILRVTTEGDDGAVHLFSGRILPGGQS